jgi:capsular exopolysaccharide synthesis family protein
MSEIFEALQKAQREADAGAASQSSDPQAVPQAADQSVPANRNGRRSGAGHPTVTRSRRPRFTWRPRWWGAASTNGKADQESPLSPLLISPHQRTAISEQFRVLRTRVETAGPGCLMVTSALDQEGKTLCATNLAVALSMSIGAGVVLIDADLRHPSVAAGLGLRDRPGLVEYLLEEVEWQDCLQPTEHERLQVLTAGRGSSLSTELLGSPRMYNLAAELKARFPRHFLIFDAPPLLLTADPLVLARHMDHVVLVVRAGVTPREAVLKAVEGLGAERFLGVIFNDAAESLSHRYYYNGRYPYGEGTESRR